MSDRKILVRKDGSVQALYCDELLPVFTAIGDPRIDRASYVYYDHGWRISELLMQGTINHDLVFLTRAAAIAYEVELLERRLGG